MNFIIKIILSTYIIYPNIALSKDPDISHNGNVKVRSFFESKKHIPYIFSHEPKTIYCGCEVVGKKVNTASCGLVFPKQNSRLGRLEIEHSVPAHSIGLNLKSYREGDPLCVSHGKKYKGRKCAEKVSEWFRLATADLWNLYPEDGAVNQLRSNHNYAQLNSSEYDFGKCQIKFENGKFEPRNEAKGQVARSSLYMMDTYGVSFSDKQVQLFEAWNKIFPVTKSECLRAKKITQVQGNTNKYVTQPCSKIMN